MTKGDARKLRAFQRQNLAYEKLLRVHIRRFINREGSKLTQMALVSDWDGFHKTLIEFKETFRRLLSSIYEDTGINTIEEFK